jgi:hypothetical protein
MKKTMVLLCFLTISQSVYANNLSVPTNVLNYLHDTDNFAVIGVLKFATYKANGMCKYLEASVTGENTYMATTYCPINSGTKPTLKVVFRGTFKGNGEVADLSHIEFIDL